MTEKVVNGDASSTLDLVAISEALASSSTSRRIAQLRAIDDTLKEKSMRVVVYGIEL